MRPTWHAILPLLLTVGAGVAGGQPVVPIADVQGSGMVSPYAGQTVTVRGVVTVLATQGFFLQSAPGEEDQDGETSEGIFVYTASAPSVSPGDVLEVTGQVTEFHELTEISQPSRVTVVGTGGGLPLPVAFDATLPSPVTPWAATALERYEGMRVTVVGGLVTGPSDQNGTFQVVAGGWRALREPGILYPGMAGLPVWDGNPEVLTVYTQVSAAAAQARAGAVVQLEGGLAEYQGLYEVWPSVILLAEPALPEPVLPSRPGELRVATQNLFRLFDDQDEPGRDDTVLSTAAYEARLAKLGAWVREMLAAPEIVAVQEVENLAALQRLGALAGDPAWNGSYQAILLEGNDPSGLDVGVLVAPWLSVESAAQAGNGASFSYDGATYRTFDRPPLLIRLSVKAGRGPWTLTLVVVHLRSLLGIEGSNGGFVRAKRKAEAEWLAGWARDALAADRGARFIMLGDFNAFQFTDGYVDVIGEISGNPDPLGALLPAADIVDPDLLDALNLLPAPERYSFVQVGNAEALDHALVSSGLRPHLVGVTFARGNADAPASWSANQGPFGASDHDGLVVTLATDAPRSARRRLFGQ